MRHLEGRGKLRRQFLGSPQGEASIFLTIISESKVATFITSPDLREYCIHLAGKPDPTQIPRDRFKLVVVLPYRSPMICQMDL